MRGSQKKNAAGRSIRLLLAGLAVSFLAASAPALAAPGEDATIVATDPPFTIGESSWAGFDYACPGGHALGGGISPILDLDEIFYVTENGPRSLGEWSARGFNFISNAHYPVAGYTICSANADTFLGNGAANFGVPAGQSFSFAAHCPSGTRAVGGGAFSGSSNTVLEASGPLDSSGSTAATDDGDIAAYWYGNIYNPGPAATGSVRVDVLCSANSDATVEATPVSLSDADPNTTVTATCPPGRRAVSGGVGVEGASVDSSLARSLPLDDTLTTAGTQTGDVARAWRVTIDSDIAGTANYKVFAMCVSDPPPPPPPPPAPAAATGQRAAALKKCKKKKTKAKRRKCRKNASRLPV
jgi:hypothetical protein